MGDLKPKTVDDLRVWANYQEMMYALFAPLGVPQFGAAHPVTIPPGLAARLFPPSREVR